MSDSLREAPDALLRHLAALALKRAQSTRDTAERIGWLIRYNELQCQAAEAATAGAD